MRTRLPPLVLAVLSCVEPPLAGAFPTAFGTAAASAQEAVDRAMTARIRAEGLERSRAPELFYELTDRIGPRLTGSPGHNRAAAWARDRFLEFGFPGARLEQFEFGRGWSVEKVSIEMTSP